MSSEVLPRASVATVPGDRPAASTRGARRKIAPLDAAVEADLLRSVAPATGGLKDALATLGRAVLSDTTKRRRD